MLRPKDALRIVPYFVLPQSCPMFAYVKLALRFRTSAVTLKKRKKPVFYGITQAFFCKADIRNPLRYL